MMIMLIMIMLMLMLMLMMMMMILMAMMIMIPSCKSQLLSLVSVSTSRDNAIIGISVTIISA